MKKIKQSTITIFDTELVLNDIIEKKLFTAVKKLVQAADSLNPGAIGNGICECPRHAISEAIELVLSVANKPCRKRKECRLRCSLCDTTYPMAFNDTCIWSRKNLLLQQKAEKK